MVWWIIWSAVVSRTEKSVGIVLSGRAFWEEQGVESFKNTLL